MNSCAAAGPSSRGIRARTSIINALRFAGAKRRRRPRPRKEYFTGGSIMQVITDPTHPVMAGMPERADVIVSNSPVFTTLDGFDGAVLAKYPSDVSPLRSGFLNGPQYMQGYAAALDVKHDQGHAILVRVPTRSGAASRRERSERCSTRRSSRTTSPIRQRARLGSGRRSRERVSGLRSLVSGVRQLPETGDRTADTCPLTPRPGIFQWAINARRWALKSHHSARVAQLDRASASGAEGHRFESCRARP